jgi:hypothetical protein
MTTEQHKATAKEYFEANPSEKVVHITTDGQVFFQKNHSDAVNHQRRIAPSEKIVSVFKNKKADEDSEEEEGEDDDNNGGDDATTTDDGTPSEEQTKAEIAVWLTEKSISAHWQRKQSGIVGES